MKRVGVAACQDGAAVHDPGRDRREVAGRHRDHRFVEQRKPFLNAAQTNQDVALLVRGQGNQVGVAESLAGRGSLPRGGGGSFQLTGPFLLKDQRQQQEAVARRSA